MKLISAQLSYYLHDNEVRQNTRALLKYVAFLLAVILIFAVLFHFLMALEGQEHSWVTGIYWTLTVMSTLGFGDITFSSDLGRIFSIIVLMSGIVLLLIVLPFAFIRFFYAPWLETQLRLRAPRSVPPGTGNHVIICSYDTVAVELVKRLKDDGIPFFVVEPNTTRAAELHVDRVPVVAGEPDDEETFAALRVETARALIANREDTVNTNIVLTVREKSLHLPIIAIASNEESIDVLELSGATHVLPLKRWLGEQLANRVGAGHAETHVIGHFHDIRIAELPVRSTPLSGKTVRETRLREVTGANIVGIWEHGHLLPAHSESRLTDSSVAVITGTAAQLESLDDLLIIYAFNPNPVLVIGGGRVGRAAAKALKTKETAVNVIEKRPEMVARVQPLCDAVFYGDAADYDLLMQAGIDNAPAVVLTTHDDAMNIFLASYCRRLNPEIRIVSRVTHERNIVAIHRAGADFVLSYESLSVNAILSVLKGRKLIVLGEGFDLHAIPLPRQLEGRTLAESEIGAKTGLQVIALQHNGTVVTNPTGSALLEAEMEIIVLGTTAQRRHFSEVYP
jgi:Trk K+ transport system NAD-binding subunit